VEIEKFHDLFFSYISHGCSGTFYRVEEGKKNLTDIINSYEFNNCEEVIKLVEQILENVSYDRRPGKGEKVNIEDQLLGEKTKLDFYNFIFGLKYLIPRFVLKLGDKDIQLLSPGEKGTLLLVFYLLIDQDKIPLLIDQPEHNLDNQTVFKLLVNCVKKAKQKRQIFIVTHNPNLAVVCDAEQIICSRIDKTTNNEVFYDTGAIENPKINKMIIDILEGTKIAFNQRRFKYLLDQYDKI
jgi:wobble nucleotide-excising tRNase